MDRGARGVTPQIHYLKGAISGDMKIRLNKLKDVVNTLASMTEASEDPLYLKMRTSELARQLKAVQEDNARVNRALEDS